MAGHKKAINGAVFTAWILAMSVSITSCNISGQEKSNKDSVLLRQLEREYIGKVEYKEENSEKIEQALDKLIQAYIGKFDDTEDTGMDISDDVKTFFNDINNAYDTASYKEDAEYAMKNDENYRVTAQVSYSRDCVIATVSYPSSRVMLKLTYADNEITTVTDYR